MKGLRGTIAHVNFRIMGLEMTYFENDDNVIKLCIFVLFDDEALHQHGSSPVCRTSKCERVKLRYDDISSLRAEFRRFHDIADSPTSEEAKTIRETIKSTDRLAV